MARTQFTATYEEFRRLLVEARLRQRLTQQDLAAKLHKPQSYVSKYERGERRLDVVEFLALAEILELDLPRFLEHLRGVPGGDKRGRK